MIKIYDMIEKAKEAGYDETNAEAKVCQDLILSLISQSQYNRNVTVKGGVVMRSITNNTRRATLWNVEKGSPSVAIGIYALFYMLLIIWIKIYCSLPKMMSLAENYRI